MQDLNDLYYFAQVVEHRGFAPAGRALGVPKSRLSRRIALLEERLGVRLIQRSTRRFSVTEIGQIYYTHCKAVLVEARAAQDAIAMHRSEPCGVIRVTCPVALLDTIIGPMVADFLGRNPGVELHLEATNRRVDLIEEGVDVALRVRLPPLQDSELVLRVLAEFDQHLVAGPTLLAGHGEPREPADLARLPSLALAQPQGDHRWTLYGPDDAKAEVHHHPRLITRGMFALRDAAMAGVGVVQLPVMVTSTEIARGRLVPVLPDWQPRREIVHAVFPSRRGLLPSVRAFVDHLVAGFSGRGAV
ncbi:LysR family transcriptional regulator [Pontibaca methylaminivorans]|uniref:Transcriptional regulator, LysR family n=1 Tax=Pontibaca methylaminivorans TaxID=515897 RepID=A0A1R3X8J2_9RHOB|nr:LysR family transcriptional regulator [Pontibaca methylaminivorans]SIT87024.1 transcriptional regulator, LysR family [Pontibaca methylaminivorans]